MNAASLTESELAAAQWALSGVWRPRLFELLARRPDLGALPDVRHMSAVEQFGLMLHLERREARQGPGKAPK